MSSAAPDLAPAFVSMPSGVDTFPKRLAVLSRGVQRVATLPALLNDAVLIMSRRPAPDSVDGVLAWGHKPSASAAEAFSTRHALPLWRIEDGFLRSVGLGDREPPLSIVLDDLGIYYDATSPSRLERCISRPHRDAERARAAGLRQAWRAGRVSKYNHAREVPPPVAGPFVLVVDQTFGDASIAYGLADEGSFVRMLEAALDEHPELPVLLKVHPDVIAGRKRGHFERLSNGSAARVRLVATDAHPPGLLEAAHAVYVVTSQMGFEALLWGKPVRVFGMPFYAGWGQTVDDLPAPSRRHPVGLDDLVHAALVEYPRYLDPETGQRCAPERLMDWMALQRRMRERFAPEVYAAGFSSWKKPIVRTFFSGSAVRFERRTQDAPAGATVATWGMRPAVEGRQTVRLEDGFLRSVGLGAHFVRPLSWVMDRSGMYYDATAASDLEILLQTTIFDDALIARARALRERIVAAGLTKYNVGQGNWQRPAGVERVVLVPGQVESDASLAHGAPGVRTNIGLLQAARAANPDAYLIYKPHPDVAAGLRKRGQGETEAHCLCDEVVSNLSISTLLDQVDAVHVMTSLTGFEALLRSKRVRCEGLPFYAGWGLTDDAHVCPRRSHRLTLDALIAGALILYPAYVSQVTGYFTTPERALEELLDWRASGPKNLPLWRRARRWLYRAF